MVAAIYSSDSSTTPTTDQFGRHHWGTEGQKEKKRDPQLCVAKEKVAESSGGLSVGLLQVQDSTLFIDRARTCTETLTSRFLSDFEACLLLSRTEDKYASQGRELLRKKISAVVDANRRITCVLPAFPCKSPNQRDKVLGSVPDAGELQALLYLDAFCHKVSTYYTPGCVIVIFSDGRVFGDLIDVPAQHRKRYRKALIKMIDEHTTFLQYDNLDCHIPLIKKTIAGVAEGSDANTDKDKDTKARRDRGDNDNDDEDRNSDDNNDEDDINFHINALLSCWENEKAKRDVEAAIHAGRKRTTEAAETMEKKVRNSRSRTSNSHNYSSDASDIEGGKQAEDAGEYLRMYRGMIKFLEYDRWHLVKAQTRPSSSSSSTPSSPSPSFISRSRLKKESARAARRILIRNSGFTQLLECLYPHSVRLSIHLHDNGGPKFAVRLLPRDNAAGRTGDGRVCGGDGQIPVANHATAALELLASPSPSSSSSYLPATPWHNVLVKMMDGRMLFVHKRKILDAQSVFLCSNRTLHACQHVFELVHRNGQPWCYQQRIKE